jgi:hypothetical protein
MIQGQQEVIIVLLIIQLSHHTKIYLIQMITDQFLSQVIRILILHLVRRITGLIYNVDSITKNYILKDSTLGIIHVTHYQDIRGMIVGLTSHIMGGVYYPTLITFLVMIRYFLKDIVIQIV